jgi:hypothetical protein
MAGYIPPTIRRQAQIPNYGTYVMALAPAVTGSQRDGAGHRKAVVTPYGAGLVRPGKR